MHEPLFVSLLTSLLDFLIFFAWIGILFFLVKKISMGEFTAKLIYLLIPAFCLLLLRIEMESYLPPLLSFYIYTGAQLVALFVCGFVLVKQRDVMDSGRRARLRDLIINDKNLLFDQLPVSVVITDLNGKIEFVNRKFIDVTGYKEEDVLGQSFRMFHSEDSSVTDYTGLWQTIARGETWKGRFLNRKKNGESYWEEGIISPLYDRKGRVTHYLGIKEDVSGKVKLDREYEKVLSAVEHTHDSVEILDRKGRIEYVNSSFVSTTGFSKEEAIGMYPLNLFWDGTLDNKLKQDELWEKVNKGQSWTGRFRNKTKDGSFIEEEVSAAPVFGKDGEIVNFTCVKRNVTDQIRAEEEQRLVKEQLFHAQKIESIGQLAGGVAHDFNNILSGIITAASLLNSPERNLDRKAHQFVDLILSSSSRAADLTNSLLSISRRGRSEAAVFSLEDIIRETMGLLEFTTDKKISIRSVYLGGQFKVYGDHSAFQSVLLNLGVNACHAISDAGMITFTLGNQFLDQEYCDRSCFALEPGLFCKLEVSDTGSGIPEEFLPHIFEPFFTTKEDGKGTGLGLSSAMRIIKEMHGEINVKSLPGKGATFILFIPVSCEEKEEEKELDVLGGDETILLVDDEDFNRSLGLEILKTLGYQVLLASNGADALKLYAGQSQDIDLVLLDMNMPVMDGRETYKKIRELNPRARIIIASGYVDDEKIRDLLKSGLDHFIAKPYDIVDFSRKIRELLDQPL